MLNLAISSRIREIKGDRHVSEVQRDIDAMDDADKMRVFAQETLDFNGFDFDFRGLMSPLSAPISNVFETPPGRSFFSPESLSQAVSRIAMGLHGRLVEVFNSLGDGASEAIQTMVVGLTVAMKHIGQVAELIPHLMKENGIELNKENYMKHFAASFEFIDDLTQLNTNDIN
ncbi:MAG: hypothetical protein OXU45_05535, partial [Candidatus Melainabacteria bacterium]|nr:hypothetical protein [Candidatus Melainabacteria bacterium]